MTLKEAIRNMEKEKDPVSMGINVDETKKYLYEWLGQKIDKIIQLDKKRGDTGALMKMKLTKNYLATVLQDNAYFLKLVVLLGLILKDKEGFKLSKRTVKQLKEKYNYDYEEFLANGD